MLKWFVSRLMVSLLACVVAFCALLWFGQELLMFPVTQNKLSWRPTVAPLPPSGIEQFYATTSDNEKIDVWTTYRTGTAAPFVAIIFHGNGETVANRSFLPFFEKLGIPAFTFDYRGYGQSSGWPSEQGIYRDGEAVWEEIRRRTALPADRLIILGNSIGSGPAAYLASKISPAMVILLAGYSDMPTLVGQLDGYRYFLPFLRYRLPTAEYLQKLYRGSVILVHGKRDTTIPFDHLARLRAAVSPSVAMTVIESEQSGHDEIFAVTEPELRNAVLRHLPELTR